MTVDSMPTEHLADVAQLVEQLIRNQQVSGSNPLVGSNHINYLALRRFCSVDFCAELHPGR